MKQPQNHVADHFGLDKPWENNAEIVVFYDYMGDTEEVLRIPFWYSHEAGSFEHFAAEVQRAATKLSECYAYWPDGYIHIQTRITKEYANGI